MSNQLENRVVPAPQRIARSAPAPRPPDTVSTAVVHTLGQLAPSEKKLTAAVRILSEECQGFGSRAAREYLARRHQLRIGWEMLRLAMAKAGTLRPKAAHRESSEDSKSNTSRAGELVHWRTRRHNWLAARREKLTLIALIDDATLALTARFVQHDSTEENIRLLGSYLERFGRPVAFCGRSNQFQSGGSHAQSKGASPTQIGRALAELEIGWTSERALPMSKDIDQHLHGLAAGLRAAGVKVLAEANLRLDHFVAQWNRNTGSLRANGRDAHRQLATQHDLDSILSIVQFRRVANDSTVRFGGRLYRIVKQKGAPEPAGSSVRIETRLDGGIRIQPVDGCSVVEVRKTRAKPSLQKPKRAARRKHTQLGKAWRGNHGEIARGDTPVWRAAQIDRARVSDRLEHSERELLALRRKLPNLEWKW
jgi:hypothetical protein